MYVLNRFSKCQCFALLLLLQLVTMVYRMHSVIQRLCQNKRFPAAKRFTYMELPPYLVLYSSRVDNSYYRFRQQKKMKYVSGFFNGRRLIVWFSNNKLDVTYQNLVCNSLMW